MFRVLDISFDVRGAEHIPRSGGAVLAQRAGEIVGVFPEATISRAFQLKTFKTGAARMAADAGVPIIPMVTWGGHRLWTKGRPKTLTRRHTRIMLVVGEPLPVDPDEDPAVVTATLAERMAALLEEAQRDYPDTPTAAEDRWWLPVRMGGTAPTPEAAAAMDEAERQARAERRRIA